MVDAEFIKEINGLEKKVRSDLDTATIALKAKLAKRGIEAYMDNGKLAFKKTDGTKVMNATGTKILTSQELMTEILDESKLLENSGGGKGNEGGGAGTGAGDGLKTTIGKDDKELLYERYPHLKKAEEHAAKVKAEIEA